MDVEADTLDTRFGRQICQLFECRNEFRPAVGITAVIDRICANKNVRCAQNLAPGEGIGEKDGVPRRHISDGDVVFNLAILRHWMDAGYGGSSKDAKIDNG